MTARAPLRHALLAAPLALVATGCESDCLGPECSTVPDVPWTPDDDGGDGEGYGYGDDGGGDAGGDDGEPLPEREIVAVRDCTVTVAHIPSGSPASVEVAGTFNDWTPTALSGPDADGVWTAELGELEPGAHAHKFILDGAWEGAPPRTAYAQWLDGSENRSLRVGDCMRPLLQTVSAETTASGDLHAVVQVAAAADEVPVDPAAVTVTVGGEPVSATVDPEEGTITVALSGLPPGKHSLRVWASDEDGRSAENEPLFVPLWVEDTPFSWEDGLMYFAFVDRFRDGDWGADGASAPIGGLAECADYNGGDLLGVIHALEDGYFDELGVNTIWLSPVTDNPEGAYLGTDGTHWYSGYHGYWPTDAFRIEGRFGDVDGDAEDRLHELITAAHARGIRVLFDLVLNHVHEDHSYIDEHPEWFGDGCVCGTADCGWDDMAVECWFTDYLPDLDYKQHALVERVTDDTLALIETYDVDAVRIDAAKHMDHVVMRTLSMRLRDEVEAGGGAQVYTVGETFTSDRATIMDYVNDTELDGQFDFPLYYAVRAAFAQGGSFYDLESTVADNAAAYGDGLMSPFLGNHDIPRFATDVTGQAGDCWSDWLEDPMADGGSTIDQWDLINRLSMGFAFVLTQPGVPLIYYGDEIGLHGGGDPDNRRRMGFAPYLSANQEALLERVQAIGQARAGSEALRRGERVQLWVDDDLLVYARDAGGGEAAVVAMNKGGSSRTETVSVGDLGLDGATLVDAVSGDSHTVSGGALDLTLGSWQYAVLVRP